MISNLLLWSWSSISFVWVLSFFDRKGNNRGCLSFIFDRRVCFQSWEKGYSCLDSCKSFFFWHLLDCFLLGSLSLIFYGELRYQRRWSSSLGKFYLDTWPLWIGFSRKLPLLVGPFYCILCWKVEEDLDQLLWGCEFARSVWNTSFRSLVLHWPTRGMLAMRLGIPPPFAL